MAGFTQSVNTFSDYGAEQQDIERKRRMAELLQQQSMQPIEANQMAGGYVLPVSWTQGLAKMLQGYAGGKGQEAATQAQKALAGKTRSEAMDWATGMPMPKTRDLNPVAMDDEGNKMPPAMQTTQPTRQELMSWALKGGLSGNPMAQGIAEHYIKQIMKTPESMFGKVDPKDYTPESIIQFSQSQNFGDLVPVRKMEAVNMAGPNGAPATGFVNPYAPPQAPIPQAVKNEMVGLGNVIQPVNPYAQTSPLSVGVSPNTAFTQANENARFGSVSGNTAATNATTRRGQDIAASPDIQGALAQARGAGTTTGQATAQAALDLPQAVATAAQSVKLIDQMIGDLNVTNNGQLVGGKVKPHPGFSVSVGASAQPGFQYVPGTDKASFYALKDQVLGGAFMEAYKTLKGGGQITEIEGQKGTAAITRMNTAQNEKEFVKAAREFQDVITAGVQRARIKANPQRRSSDILNAADAILKGQ